MTNLKALLKFTHDNISSNSWDMFVDDYAEFMYLHGKAQGELERLEEMSEAMIECPPSYDGSNCDDQCEDCWRTYVETGGE